jgi:hypothetical protein
MASALFEFPNPVNDKAARTVATGVIVLSLTFLVTGWTPLLWILALGFLARVLTGPTLSPLGQLATRVIAPRLGAPRFTPGPPKRFAQMIGLSFSAAAIIIHATAGTNWAKVVIGALAFAATLEAAFGFCLGCKVFSILMRIGIIPASVCEECADITSRYPELSRP